MSRRDKQVPWMGRSVRLVGTNVAGLLGLALVDAAVAQQAQSLSSPAGAGDPVCVRAGRSDDHDQSRDAEPFPNWRWVGHSRRQRRRQHGR